jgi:hypothetical protein
MSNVIPNTIRAIVGVPTMPRDLAVHPGFPEDLDLYRTLRDHLGKVGADQLWADANLARDGRQS